MVSNSTETALGSKEAMLLESMQALYSDSEAVRLQLKETADKLYAFVLANYTDAGHVVVDERGIALRDIANEAMKVHDNPASKAKPYVLADINENLQGRG